MFYIISLNGVLAQLTDSIRNWRRPDVLRGTVHAAWRHPFLRWCTSCSRKCTALFGSLEMFEMTCALLGSISLWTHPYHRPPEDILLFRAQTKAPRHYLFHRRHSSSLLQMAFRRRHSRDIWFSQFIWVCLLHFRSYFAPDYLRVQGTFSLLFSLSYANFPS